MAKQYYVLFYVAPDADGSLRPYLPNATVFTGGELKKHVANNGMPAGHKIASCQEVAFTVTKKTVSVEIDDLAIGAIVPNGV